MAAIVRQTVAQRISCLPACLPACLALLGCLDNLQSLHLKDLDAIAVEMVDGLQLMYGMRSIWC
ncbi:MAG: hypothetical protein WA484_04145 [Solirubrobacteraceae bacterium]